MVAATAIDVSAMIDYRTYACYDRSDSEGDVISQFVARFGFPPPVIIHDDYWRLGPVEVFDLGSVFPICQEEQNVIVSKPAMPEETPAPQGAGETQTELWPELRADGALLAAEGQG